MGKRHKSSTADASAQDDSKREPELQAVLLADSFTKTFRPLSLDQSKVLCPLNNVTLLDYALEFTAGAGVKELFVVCTNDAVEAHIDRHRGIYSKRMAIVCIKDTSLTNAGDALRELDQRNLIQSDPFLLMHGDVVANVDLQPVMQAHKQRHKRDSSAIMTMLFHKVGGCSSLTHYSNLRSVSREDLVVGLDPLQENRILAYDDHVGTNKVQLPCSFFVSHSGIELHTDLMDCGIDVCSPDLLASLEFDYRDLRREFVANSVAEEEEGLQHKLYAHVIGENEYAARAHDWATYHALSQDLLKRWCYPIVPDNLPSGYEQDTRYAFQRHFLYKEQRHPGKMGRSSVLTGPGMLGRRCFVGEHCVIRRTVIGHGCHIQSGVTIQDSHLWDNAVVEEGATIESSVLGHDCVIRAGATVSRGCVIGNGCVIGAGIQMPAYTRITKAYDLEDAMEDDGFGSFDDDDGDDDDNDDSSELVEVAQEEASRSIQSDHAVVGPDGVGRVWLPSTLEESDEEDEEQGVPIQPLEAIKAQSVGFDPLELYRKRLASQQEEPDGFSDEEDELEEPLDDQHDYGNYDEDVVTFGGLAPTHEDTSAGLLMSGVRRGVDVVKELKQICLEHEVSSPIENLSIELNSFKFSQNATYSDCTMAATLAILEKMQIESGSMSPGKLVVALKHQLEHWAPLLQKMSIGLEEEKSIVVALEMAATEDGEMGEALRREPSFRFMLQTLHDEEVVGEEAILAWAAERKKDDADSPKGKLFQQQPTQDFLEWLEEESEDDSGGYDSDEESDNGK